MASCSPAPNLGPLENEEQVEVLRKDLQSLFEGEELQRPLSLYEAMARGISYNLDHRLAAAQEAVAQGDIRLATLQALPSLDAKGQFVGRSSDSASSSRSVLTGDESLQPSISTDRLRTTSSLDLSWNFLDTGLSAVRRNQTKDKALIAAEQRRKVIHNIVQDVRTAYWRAAALQDVSKDLDTLMTKGQKAVDKIHKIEKNRLQAPETALAQQSRLLESMNKLMEMRTELASAKSELAGLINLPPDQPFQLESGSYDFLNLKGAPQVKTKIQDLELAALLSRPEIREELYNRRVAANDVRLSVFETFPGFEALFSVNKDSNSFLENQEWASFSLGFTQSLMRLFTLPARMKQAKNQQELTDLKRQALAAAIMAQVRISTTRMDLATSRLKLMKQIYGVNSRMAKLAGSKRIAKVLTPAEGLEVDMDLLVTKIRAYMAFVEVQNSYGQVLSSVGIDPLPAMLEDSSIPGMSAALKARLTSLEETSFETLLKNFDNTETKIMNKAASEARPKRKPKIPLNREFKSLQTTLLQTEKKT